MKVKFHLCRFCRRLLSIHNLDIRRGLNPFFLFTLFQNYGKIMVDKIERSYKFMSVRSKLNIGYIVFFIVFATASIFSLVNLSSVGNKVETLVDETIEQTVIVKEIQRAIATQGMFLRAYYLEPSQFNIDQLDSYNQLLTDQVNTLAAFESNSEIKSIISNLKTESDQIIATANRAVTAIDQNNLNEALTLINEDFSEANAQIYALTVSLSEKETSLLNSFVDDTKDTVALTMNATGVALLFGIAIISYLALFVRGNIIHPLKELNNQATVIASGDLSQPDYVHKHNNEIGKITIAFSDMKNSLRNVLLNVSSSTQHVRGSYSVRIRNCNRCKTSI